MFLLSTEITMKPLCCCTGDDAQETEVDGNKSTQRVQISNKAVYCPLICTFESQRHDPDDPPKFDQFFLVSLQSYPENLINIHS